jgi:hypothetical protein
MDANNLSILLLYVFSLSKTVLENHSLPFLEFLIHFNLNIKAYLTISKSTCVAPLVTDVYTNYIFSLSFIGVKTRFGQTYSNIMFSFSTFLDFMWSLGALPDGTYNSYILYYNLL